MLCGDLTLHHPSSKSCCHTFSPVLSQSVCLPGGSWFIALCVRCTALSRCDHLVDSQVVLYILSFLSAWHCFTIPDGEESEDFGGRLHLTTTSFQYLLLQLLERHLVCCQDLFSSNLFSSWVASLKLLRTQWLKIFRGRSCLLPVDMGAPESTFVKHCGKFAMFLDGFVFLFRLPYF